MNNEYISIQRNKEPIKISKESFRQDDKIDVRQIIAAQDFDRSMRMNAVRNQADKKMDASRNAVVESLEKRYYRPSQEMNISKSDDIDRDELSRLFTSGTYVAVNGIPLWMLRLIAPFPEGVI